MKVVLSRRNKRNLFLCVALMLIILVAGCGGKSSSSSSGETPRERTYSIENPNLAYEGKSSAERSELLFESMSNLTNGTVVPLTFEEGYEVVFAYINYDLNIHTNPQSAKVQSIVFEIGKPTSDYAMDSSFTVDEAISRFNTQNRSRWMYGPYESTVPNMTLTLDLDNPILRRHLDTLSYNHPIEITTILEDKPLLIFPQLVVLFDGTRNDYTIYEWQAIGDHRYRLAIEKGSEAESTFDVEGFIISTFE